MYVDIPRSPNVVKSWRGVGFKFIDGQKGLYISGEF